MIGVGHQVFKGLVLARNRPGGNGSGQKDNATAFWTLYNEQAKPLDVPLPRAQASSSRLCPKRSPRRRSRPVVRKRSSGRWSSIAPALPVSRRRPHRCWRPTPMSTAHMLRGSLVVATSHWHDLAVDRSPDAPLSFERVGDT
jgi:hypothetical protein